MESCTVIKIGGQLLDHSDSLASCLMAFTEIQGKKILIHGGGKSGSNMLKKLGIEVQYIDGRRITDQATLEVVTQVYAGSVNKKVVSTLQSLGENALGLSGCDLNVISAHKRTVGKINYGYAGDIDSINTDCLTWLMKKNVIPVLNSITHDGHGQLLNTNADTIASEVAIALSPYYQVCLHYCFEMPGVMKDLQDPDSLLVHLNLGTYQKLKENGTISSGMIPKLDNGFKACQHGVKVAIGNSTHFCSPQSEYTSLEL